MASSAEQQFEKERENKEEEEEKQEGDEEDEDERVVKWAKHYSSAHHILLVGEGDFSFSLCLANAFDSASKIVATSLDSHDTVLKKYDKAKANLESLKKLGATTLHEVNATKLKFHSDLKMQKFDMIIFNFPHAGFRGKEDDVRMINRHRLLVNSFFENARYMLRPCGEVHVSHKIGGPFAKWNLEKLASRNSLILVECAKFDSKDYPGYNNKRGDGPRCDEPFPLGECRTFKFKIGRTGKRKKAMKLSPGFIRTSSCMETMVANPSQLESLFSSRQLPATPSYSREGWTGMKFSIDVVGIPSTLDCSSRIRNSNVSMNKPVGSVLEAFRNNGDPLRNRFQAYLNEAQGNTAFGYSNNLEVHIARFAWLRYLINKHGKEEEAVNFRQTSFPPGSRQLHW